MSQLKTRSAERWRSDAGHSALVTVGRRGARKGPRLDWRKKLLFALVPATVLFAGAEIGCRLAFGWNESWVDCHRFHPVLGWCLREGWNGTWYWTGGHSRINAEGIRHDEPLGPKAPREKRLLVLGDSVTFGAAVPTDQAYPAQLQKAIAAAKPDWRILNGGVTGYDPAQEAEWLEFFGCSLDPDALAIGFCRNDTCPSMRLNGLWRVDSKWAAGNWLLEHSIVIYKLHRAFWRWRAHVARQSGELLPGQPSPDHPFGGWAFLEQNYRKIDRIARAHHWPVVLFVFPTRAILENPPPADKLTADLHALAAELGWSVIDLAAAFEPSAAELFLRDDDIHPNAEGYCRAAAKISSELLASNWLW